MGGRRKGKKGEGRDGALEFGQKAVLPVGSRADAGQELAVWSWPGAPPAGSLRGLGSRRQPGWWRESMGFMVEWLGRAVRKLRHVRRARTGGEGAGGGSCEDLWRKPSNSSTLKTFSIIMENRTALKRYVRRALDSQRRHRKNVGEGHVCVCRVPRPLGGGTFSGPERLTLFPVPLCPFSSPSRSSDFLGDLGYFTQTQS